VVRYTLLPTHRKLFTTSSHPSESGICRYRLLSASPPPFKLYRYTLLPTCWTFSPILLHPRLTRYMLLTLPSALNPLPPYYTAATDLRGTSASDLPIFLSRPGSLAPFRLNRYRRPPSLGCELKRSCMHARKIWMSFFGQAVEAIAFFPLPPFHPEEADHSASFRDSYRDRRSDRRGEHDRRSRSLVVVSFNQIESRGCLP